MLELSFSFFPLKKNITPYCSTVPASLQAWGPRPRNCNKGKGRAKKSWFCILGQILKIFPACQSGCTFLFASHLLTSRHLKEKINSSVWEKFDYHKKEKESKKGVFYHTNALSFCLSVSLWKRYISLSKVVGFAWFLGKSKKAWHKTLYFDTNDSNWKWRLRIMSGMGFSIKLPKG